MPFDYTGSFSGSFVGDITASNGVVSSSLQVIDLLPSGIVSSSIQVDYRNIRNRPTTITAFQRNSIIANSNFRETTYPEDSASFDFRIKNVEGNSTTDSASFSSRITILESAIDDTGSDAQTLSFNQVSSILSISNGNSVDLSSLQGGGGSSIWSTGSDYFYVSADLQVTGSFKVFENVIAESFTGSIDWINLDNVPSGLISGSSQITDVITDEYISASVAASGFGSGNGTTIDTGSFAVTSSNIFTDSQEIQGNLTLSGGNRFVQSDTFTGSLIVLSDQHPSPTPIAGGIYYSSSQFFVGIE
jgi:hypothetical protein